MFCFPPLIAASNTANGNTADLVCLIEPACPSRFVWVILIADNSIAGLECKDLGFCDSNRVVLCVGPFSCVASSSVALRFFGASAIMHAQC